METRNFILDSNFTSEFGSSQIAHHQSKNLSFPSLSQTSTQV